MSVFVYKTRRSRGARLLARGLGARCSDLTRVRPHRPHVIVNWGNTAALPGRPEKAWRVFNEPVSVEAAANKIEALSGMARSGVPTVRFTVSREEAEEWNRRGYRVMCRTLLRASEGRGLVVVDAASPDPMPQAPLYTRYFPGRDEYRVHVIGGRAVDVQRKRVRNGEAERNIAVRNHGNGWVFCREGVVLPDAARDAAERAVTALGLDFGAVDLKVGDLDRTRVAVMEVNTAPGLEGTTLETYVNGLRALIREYGE